MHYLKQFSWFLSACQQIENLSISFDLTKGIEDTFQIWYQRDRDPIQIHPSGYQNFFDLASCVNHIPTWPIKSLVIYYFNRNNIDDCHSRMARCLHRFFREHTHLLDCLWAPISFKDYFVLKNSSTGDFHRMISPNLKNMITWVWMKLKFWYMIEIRTYLKSS